MRNGAPKIRGTPVWEDISKLEDGQLLTHEDIVKASKEFLSRNEHLRERFEIWKNNQGNEGEVLIKGDVPKEAVYSQSAIRLHRVLNGTGKVLFERKRLSGVGTLYSSPVAANGHLYFTGRDGTSLVLKDNASLDVVATNQLSDAIDASMVAVGDQVFLRSWTKLYCIQK